MHTDNNPLTYVLTSEKLNAVGLRWVADLADFQFTIKYRPGKVNVDADYLSRRVDVTAYKSECSEEFDPCSITAVVSSSHVCDTMLSNLVCSADVMSLQLRLNESRSLDPVTEEQLSQAQQADPVIGPIYHYVLMKHRPDQVELQKLSRSSRILLKSFAQLRIENGILLRATKKFQQIVLPTCFHDMVYTELHDRMAHLGVERVLDLAIQRFYWPLMGKDISNYIRKRCRCIVSKKPNVAEKAPLVPIQATYPFEMVAIDFLHLDKCKGGFEYALVVCDHYTRFSQVYATRSKSSKAAADKLFNEFILQFGFPKMIHHDRGGEFNSDLFRELHRLTGIKSSSTTPYHAMGNGQVERMNRSLCNMLKALSEKEKKDWKRHLPKLAFAYNSTINKTTGYSPFYLLFGRQSILPIDTVFSSVTSRDVKRKSYREFVDDWKNSMSEARDIVARRIEKAAEYNKDYYNKKARCVEIEIGDQVLVRNIREKGGTGKLRNHWESNIFKVVDKKADCPVYTVENIKMAKDRRILHRNLLFRCNDLPAETFEEEDYHKRDDCRKNKGKERQKNVQRQKKEQENMEEMDSENDIEFRFVVNSNEDGPAIDRDEINGDENLLKADGDDGSSSKCIEELHHNIDLEERTESSADETFHGFPESDVTDSDDSEPVVNRRSCRQKVRTKTFTYDKIGGEPIRR